jgi:tRNA(adenine34) deaminase
MKESSTEEHLNHMKLALKAAAKAKSSGEVPIGAVIVRNGNVISTGYNQVEEFHDATLHAEIIAIRRASKKLGNWRLTGCTIYVTLQPCEMCLAALRLARIDKIVFGSFRKNMRVTSPNSIGGIMREQTDRLLSNFFKELR